jgi:hypothetical protein
MRRTILGAACAGVLGAIVIGAGCTGGSRRGTEGAPAPGAAATSAAGWARVPVKRVDLKPEAGTYRLEAQASVPSAGWKVEIRPLPVTVPSAREFEVVGLAPAAGASGAPTLVVASIVVDLDAAVEQVAVYDEDDATLLTPP